MKSPLYSRLPELIDLEETITQLGEKARVTTLSKVRVTEGTKTHTLPLYCIAMGSQKPDAPVFAVFGGVHGLERIGTQVVTSFLKTLAQLLRWDTLTNHILEDMRLLFVPLVNPGGMYLQTRSNPRGVDLMRNSPVEADIRTRAKLYVGHRISKHLPWYRGKKGEPMEEEALALKTLVEREIFPSSVAISVDVHSGFGMLDRLWFPYAKTKVPFPQLAEVYALKLLLDATYPNHVYCIEPQSKQYLTHGDLWDHLYDSYRERHPAGIYLPLCLELGSWVWVKKNPKQLFSSLGVFNPIEQHRYQRILRRHLILMDFLVRATYSHPSWTQSAERHLHQENAKKLWYIDQK